MNLTALHQKYLDLADPTEYLFAITYVGDWDTWETICNTEEYKPVIAKWRSELEAKIKSDAMRKILKASKSDTRDALQANKYLLETTFFRSDKRGRPSKAEIQLEAKKLAEDSKRIQEDFRRIFEDAVQEDEQE